MLLPGDYFQLSKPVSGTGPKPSVDTLFNSIGKIKKEYAIGIVLSGTGKDGSKTCKIEDLLFKPFDVQII